MRWNSRTLPSALCTIFLCLSASCGGAGTDPAASQPVHAAPPTETPAGVLPQATNAPIGTATPAPNENLALGDRALLEGDFLTAQSRYRAALAAGIEPDRAAFFLARAQLDGGDPAGAQATLQNLLATQPTGAYALRSHFLLGEAEAELTHWDAAGAAYQQFLIEAANQPIPVTGLDALVLERIGDSYVAGGNTDLAVQSFNAAAEMAAQSESLRLQERAGDVLLEAGQREAALTVYDRVLTSAASDWTRARLNRKIGGILITLERADEGYQRYQAALDYPLAYDAYLCLADLVEAGFTPDELVRGIIDFHAGAYNPAVQAFTRYLETAPAEPARALYFRGLSYQEMDQIPAAVLDFKAAAAYGPEVSVWDDALFELAYTMWGWQDDFTGASAVLAGLADAQPAHPRAAEALNDAARIAERGDDLRLAAQIWNRLAEGYPASEDAVDASHLAGISLFRLGEFPGAETYFARQSAASDLHLRSRALFWVAKSRTARGDTDGAKAAYTEAAAADPTGYYSERAKDVLAGRKPLESGGTVNLTFDPDAEYREAEAWLLSVWPQATPETAEAHYALVENDARLVRGRLLWDLGLYEGALAEFTGLRTSLASDPIASLYLSRYLVNLGCYEGAIYSARQVLDALGYSDAQTLAAPAYFSHVRFGPYFADLLVPQAVKYTLDPLLLFALVRHESKFGVTAVSPANAHGLMQLIPPTAEEMAGELGITGYTQGDLYRPVINIQLGSRFLAKQRDNFNGDIIAALAYYNGGTAAYTWWELAEGDDDLFVEVIRYAETRNYIPFIYEQFVIYRDTYTTP